MARNTNINDVIFPVECKPVYLEKKDKPLRGFRAVTGKLSDDTEVVFSIVSDNYELVTNKEALELGKFIHKKLFPNATSESFEVFNIITPLTKSYCHIDIIDKNYKLNIWKDEVYVPFVRIQNSYNRTMPLKFQIGFSRKLCDNGDIFEKDLVTISITHTKHSFRTIDLQKINVDHFKKYENDFINKTKKSVEIELPRKYFLPLAAKVLNRNFDLNEKDEKKLAAIKEKLKEFAIDIDTFTDKYIRIEKMAENAYAFFNVITDYASNIKHLQARNTNELQARCGEWLNLLPTKIKKPAFSWEEEVSDHIDLIQYS